MTSASVVYSPKPQARLLAKHVEIPFGGTRTEWYLKLCATMYWYHGSAIDELPDVPMGYRGEIEVMDLHDLGLSWNAPIGTRFTAGSYHLRLIDSQVYMASHTCVLDGPFAFVPVWLHRFYRLRYQFAWRLIATLRVWGLLKSWDMNVVHRVTWRDIRPLDWAANLFKRRNHA